MKSMLERVKTDKGCFVRQVVMDIVFFLGVLPCDYIWDGQKIGAFCLFSFLLWMFSVIVLAKAYREREW